VQVLEHDLLGDLAEVVVEQRVSAVLLSKDIY
jgi:hypothetical protein